MLQLFTFSLDSHQYALPLSNVLRVVPMVEITPLPDVPDVIIGIVNVQGCITPVFNIRKRFLLQQREITLDDQLLLAYASKTLVGIIVDQVDGLVECSEENIVSADTVLPDLVHLDGVAKLTSGMVLIQNLDRFLSLEEAVQLDQAMKVPDLT